LRRDFVGLRKGRREKEKVVLLRDAVFRGEPLCMEFSFFPLSEWVWGTTESFDFDFISWKGPSLAFWAHRRSRICFC
jgi:hypothetical protein